MSEFTPAEDLLRTSLIDRCIDRFSLGDTWELHFDNSLWLVAHELRFQVEAKLQALLDAESTLLGESVDPGDPVRSLLLASVMRRPVTSLTLTRVGELSIRFDKSLSVSLLADTDVVDWQWSIAATPEDPYSAEALVYCLGPGEVRIGVGRVG